MFTLTQFFDALQDSIDDAALQIEKQVSNNKAKDLVDKFSIRCEIPGFEKNEISLSVVGDYLYVDAKNSENSARKTYLLSNNIDKDNIDATLKNGVLTIILQKKTASKSKKIEIK